MFPDFWNKGIGYKVALEIMEYIKNTKWSINIKQVTTVIHKDNIYAKKIFKKLNFNLKEKNVKNNFDQYVLVL